MTGRDVVVCSWASTVLFTVVGVLDLVLEDFGTVAAVVCAVLFFVSLPVWTYVLGLAILRTGRGDDVAVGSLFFLHGSAPATVRRRLLWSLTVAVAVAAVTAAANPYAVLEPMLPLALCGLWGARHGTFPPRR